MGTVTLLGTFVTSCRGCPGPVGGPTTSPQRSDSSVTAAKSVSDESRRMTSSCTENLSAGSGSRKMPHHATGNGKSHASIVVDCAESAVMSRRAQQCARDDALSDEVGRNSESELMLLPVASNAVAA
jgi:hypothetical protein